MSVPWQSAHGARGLLLVSGDPARVAGWVRRGLLACQVVPLGRWSALVHCTVDLSGRPYCVHTGEPDGQVYAIIGGDYAGSLTQHVFETLAFNAAICIHIRVLSGRDPHHIVEAQFKAFARALRAAVEPDPRVEGIPSTKGAL